MFHFYNYKFIEHFNLIYNKLILIDVGNDFYFMNDYINN